MSYDLERILELAQDVIDRCSPVVPSMPIMQLAEASHGFLLENDDPELEHLADAISGILDSWYFWPPDDYGSPWADGITASSLANLEIAIKAALEREESSEMDTEWPDAVESV